MPVDTCTWRARRAQVGSVRRSACKPALNRGSYDPTSFDPVMSLLKIAHFADQLSRIASAIIIYPLLLMIILSHLLIVVACILKFKASRAALKKVAPFKFWFPSMHQIIVVAFLSLVTRSLLIRSGSVHVNPGPRGNRVLSFATWNVNSLLAREGVKKSYIEAEDSLRNFDIFGVCESALTDRTQINELNIDRFLAVPERADCKKIGKAKGGVCLYYKDHVPLTRKKDLEFLDESIVAEINLGGKKVIFMLVYRSPSQTAAEFQSFMQNLGKFFNKASSMNPSTIVITGDLNAKSHLFWDEGKKKQ
jgi:hypothetical protein